MTASVAALAASSKFFHQGWSSGATREGSKRIGIISVGPSQAVADLPGLGEKRLLRGGGLLRLVARLEDGMDQLVRPPFELGLRAGRDVLGEQLVQLGEARLLLSAPLAHGQEL